MKNEKMNLRLIVCVIGFVFIHTFHFSQSLQKMSYQALIRNGSGQLIVNSPIGVQLTILQGSITGSVYFRETHLLNSNENGLITLEIGGGNISIDNPIDWANGPYFLKTETDPNGGTNYTIQGATQLLRVPYAIYADKAGNVPQTIDSSATNELQTLSISGNEIAISNGNSVSLPPSFSGDYNDLTNSPDLSGYVQSPAGVVGVNTYLKNNGSGLLSWSAISLTDKVFNVLSYGAYSDGSNSVATTEAVQNAITALLSDGRGVLYFPAGIYKLNSTILINLGTTGSINIRGDGPGISRINWTSATNGFEIIFNPEGGYDGDKRSIIVQELSLLTSAFGTGSAIKLVNNGSSAPTPLKQIKNIVTAGITTSNFWEYGVRLSGCTFTNITSLHYQGNPFSPGGTAILLEGTNDPVDTFISNLRVFHAENGIEITGNNEGVYIDQSVILFVKKGIYWHTLANEPLLSITGSHINAYECCIYGENLIQGIISNNLLYQNTNYASDWNGIYLTGTASALTDFIQIAHNTIHGWKTTTSNAVNGIVIEKKSRSIIQGNILHDVEIGIWLLPTSENCFVLDNFIQNFVTSDINNQGLNNTIRGIP